MVSIYAVHYNRIEFLSLQWEQLKKHCKDEFAYFAVNNGVDIETKNEISRICKLNGINEIIINQDNRQSYCSHDHIIALDILYKEHLSIDESEVRVVMDNDVIAYNDFSFYDIIREYDIAGFYQQSMIDYSSAIFTMYKNTVDLNGFSINGGFGDSGSGTGHLIRDHHYSTVWVSITAPMKEMEGKYVFSETKEGALPYNPFYYLQFIAHCFIHFYRGTGWDNRDDQHHKNKMEFFLHFINNVELYNPKLDEHSCYPKAHMDEWLWKENYRLYKVIQ